MSLRFLALLLPAGLAAQTPPDLAAERADFARWLETSPVSPFAAVYHQPLQDRVRFGPGGEPGLESLPAATLTESRGRLTLATASGDRALPRDRDVPLGQGRIRVSGPRGRAVVTAFGPVRGAHAPGWYPYDPRAMIFGSLEREADGASRRLLGLDGIEVDATLAGAFVARFRDRALRLTVYRMPVPGTEEADLMIFFRDGTSGDGTYPAGRFVALRPAGGGFVLDFNRARNPFCAYNGLFPCPVPWPRNTVLARIEAGERYQKP